MVNRGFTLIELLVALAIIALLLSLVVPNYFGSVTRADEAVLKENLYLMRDAIDKHYADTGRYPASLDEIGFEEVHPRSTVGPDHAKRRHLDRGPAKRSAARRRL